MFTISSFTEPGNRLTQKTIVLKHCFYSERQAMCEHRGCARLRDGGLVSTPSLIQVWPVWLGAGLALSFSAEGRCWSELLSFLPCTFCTSNIFGCLLYNVNQMPIQGGMLRARKENCVLCLSSKSLQDAWKEQRWWWWYHFQIDVLWVCQDITVKWNLNHPFSLYNSWIRMGEQLNTSCFFRISYHMIILSRKTLVL